MVPGINTPDTFGIPSQAKELYGTFGYRTYEASARSRLDGVTPLVWTGTAPRCLSRNADLNETLLPSIPLGDSSGGYDQRSSTTRAVVTSTSARNVNLHGYSGGSDPMQIVGDPKTQPAPQELPAPISFGFNRKQSFPKFVGTPNEHPWLALSKRPDTPAVISSGQVGFSGQRDGICAETMRTVFTKTNSRQA
ncbi:hypothetical protein ANO11243_068060 [Dothideomycetidae sp. 11243]|nr:hypothetical protein ANO11243_068060 [fungal sp. No.11243]